jgi:hypothetical protein
MNNITLEKTLKSIDNIYLSNPEGFHKITVQGEEQLQRAI